MSLSVSLALIFSSASPVSVDIDTDCSESSVVVVNSTTRAVLLLPSSSLASWPRTLAAPSAAWAQKLTSSPLGMWKLSTGRCPSSPAEADGRCAMMLSHSHDWASRDRTSGRVRVSLSDGDDDGRARNRVRGFPPPATLGWTKALADTRVTVRAASVAVGATIGCEKTKSERVSPQQNNK